MNVQNSLYRRFKLFIKALFVSSNTALSPWAPIPCSTHYVDTHTSRHRTVVYVAKLVHETL